MTFDCPRCHEPAESEYYGPCATCRGQLRCMEPPPRRPDLVAVVTKMDGSIAWNWVGPRVDDVSFVGREAREAAVADAEALLRERMTDRWPSHLIPGGS